jgi:hypothetical protein
LDAVKSHILISGTGRAGTTFLIRLLGELGGDTGFLNPEQSIDPISHAGLEVDLLTVPMPRVVKSPFACEKLAVALERKLYTIEHCFVPIRDLFSAAESRRRISRIHGNLNANTVPGGIWDTDRPEEQENELTHKFYHLMLTFAQYNIPHTLLEFPRLVMDVDYLWRNISTVFPKIKKSHFYSAFHDLVRPEWIHRFEKFGVAE